MELLKERILREATVTNNDVLKLDALLNHQVDPLLTMEMGKEFARLFAEHSITKVIPIESSGIPVAFATAIALNVPLLFARRKKTLIADPDSYCETSTFFYKRYCDGYYGLPPVSNFKRQRIIYR